MNIESQWKLGEELEKGKEIEEGIIQFLHVYSEDAANDMELGK
jgi:hypothetical protein